jgi:hypothetical protein
MKTLLAIAATALAGLALPQTAEAGHSNVSVNLTYQSGHGSCGCPIYTQRVFAGYDCYRRPVYRYVSVPVRHSCHASHSRYNSPQYSNHGYAQRGYSQRGYSQTRYTGRSYGNSGGYSCGQSRGCR